MNEQESQNGYLDLFVSVLAKAREKLKDDGLALGVAQEVGKSLRAEMLSVRRSNGSKASSQRDNGSDRPSQKQLEFLRDLGVEVPMGITRQQASELIDQATGRR